MTPCSIQFNCACVCFCTFDVQTYLHLRCVCICVAHVYQDLLVKVGPTSRTFSDLIQKEKKTRWISSPALRPNLSVTQSSEQLKKLIFSLPYVPNSLLNVHPRRAGANCRDGVKISWAKSRPTKFTIRVTREIFAPSRLSAPGCPRPAKHIACLFV